MGNSQKKSKIIIVGLDNSGKSTMINKLKPQKVIHNSPYPSIHNATMCSHMKLESCD